MAPGSSDQKALSFFQALPTHWSKCNFWGVIPTSGLNLTPEHHKICRKLVLEEDGLGRFRGRLLYALVAEFCGDTNVNLGNSSSIMSRGGETKGKNPAQFLEHH